MLTPEQQLAYAYSWAERKTATFTAQDDEARQQVIDWKYQVLASLAIDSPAKWDGHFNLRRLRFPRLPEGALTLSPTLGVELDLAENNIEALDTSPSPQKVVSLPMPQPERTACVGLRSVGEEPNLVGSGIETLVLPERGRFKKWSIAPCANVKTSNASGHIKHGY